MLMAALLLRLLLAPLSHTHEVPWTYKGNEERGCFGVAAAEEAPFPFVLQK